MITPCMLIILKPPLCCSSISTTTQWNPNWAVRQNKPPLAIPMDDPITLSVKYLCLLALENPGNSQKIPNVENHLHSEFFNHALMFFSR